MALTTTVKLFVALRCCELTAARFESVATVVNKLVLGTWATTGVHEITPALLITAFVGPLINEYEMGLTGTSESEAAFVTINGVSATMVRFVCGNRTGGTFISLTTTLKVLVALSGGNPPSVTTVVIVFVLGP